MIEFKQVQHSVRRTSIIEVWVDGRFKAAIYPNDTETGIRVISRYVQGEPLLRADGKFKDDVRGWEFKF